MALNRLSMAGVQKSFGATRALKNVTLEIREGEIHALIGENGAGKSTLMKILSGACSPDAGKIELNGKPFRPDDPLRARRSGVAMIYQELNLAPHLSVEENILLGEEPARWGWLNRERRRSLARQALAELHHETIPLEIPVSRLTIAEQQVVEIARALIGKPQILIMDEPTSSLTQVDTENLFKLVLRLRDRGVSIIYISHFLEECQRICDRYTVLRDGETVGHGSMPGTDVNEIIRMMVGREMTDIYPRIPHQAGETILRLNKVSGKERPSSVSFNLRQGEILGVAGLIGSGRTETLRTCFGLDRLHQGGIHVEEKLSRRGTPTSRLGEGIGFLSENRKEEGLMLNRSIADNLTGSRFGSLSRFGFINPGKQFKTTQEWMRQLDIRARSPLQPIGELSGGNQQKVAIGRLLHHDVKVLLLDEPTRGIDVGSKAQVYKLIGQLAAQGKAVIFVSSYLPELMGVCDTIGVMCRGVLSDVRPVTNWTEQSIIGAAIGQQSFGRGRHQ